MPTYTVRCRNCAEMRDIFRSIAEFDRLPSCCGETMSRVYRPPNIRADVAPYRSMATGEMVTGRLQHREHLKRHDLVEVGNEHRRPKPQEGDHRVTRGEVQSAIHEVQSRGA